VELKEYCDFVEIEYNKLLSHRKTRWSSLFPSIERLIHMFQALKSYFLSQEKPTIVIKRFFDHEFSKIYLCQMHSLMSVFQLHTQRIERESNSVVEVLDSLNSIKNILNERKSLLPLKVKELLAEERKEGFARE
jgi:hypothetical protein